MLTEQELIQAAIAARANAYAPYSNFLVGAALQVSDGRVFTGCNVENSSYGLTVCAERNAICQMIAAGTREFDRIVVVAAPMASPCGACRQFIVEFGSKIEVVCVDAAETSSIKRWSVSELIPDHFVFSQKHQHQKRD